MANNDTVSEKKLEYNVNRDDFSIEHELTVTITLHEYRDLIRNDATRKEQVEKANSAAYEAKRSNEALKKENDELKSELYSLKKELDGLKNPQVTIEAADNEEEY